DVETDRAAVPIGADAEARQLALRQATAPFARLLFPFPNAEPKRIESASHRGVDGGIGDGAEHLHAGWALDGPGPFAARAAAGVDDDEHDTTQARGLVAGKRRVGLARGRARDH